MTQPPTLLLPTGRGPGPSDAQEVLEIGGGDSRPRRRLSELAGRAPAVHTGHHRDAPATLGRGAPGLFPASGTSPEAELLAQGRSAGEQGDGRGHAAGTCSIQPDETPAPARGCGPCGGGLGARAPFADACRAIGVSGSGPLPAGRTRPGPSPHTALPGTRAAQARAGRGGVTEAARSLVSSSARTKRAVRCPEKKRGR